MNNLTTSKKCKLEIDEETLNFETSILTETSDNSLQLTAGTVLGPYAVKKIKENETFADELKFSVNDNKGQKHVFLLLDWESYILKQVCSASSGMNSNCMIMEKEDKLFVIITKTVQSPIELNAIFVTIGENILLCLSNFKVLDQKLAVKLNLKGIKKHFTCSKCSVGFTNPETLKRHQNFYCKKVSRVSPQPTTSTIPNSIDFNCSQMKNSPKTSSNITIMCNEFPLRNEVMRTHPASCIFNLTSNAQMANTNGSDTTSSTEFLIKQSPLITKKNIEKIALTNLDLQQINNSIVLPVAYHNNSDQTLIQLIGSPQTVIPVAVHRNCSSTLQGSRPLLIDEAHVENIFVPTSQIPIKATLNTKSSQNFNLTLAFNRFNPTTSKENELKISTTDSTDSSINNYTKLEKTTSSADNLVPLDLSTSSISKSDSIFSKRRKLTSAENNLSNLIEKNLSNKCSSKRWFCDCGVSFVAEETLNGHKKYYCKNRKDYDEEQKSQQHFIKKNPLVCQLCKFQTITQSQLIHHVKTIHTSVQSYVCLLCGYKGYSPRGIKNHLRISHPQEIQLKETDLVFCVKAETKQFTCKKCQQNFPTAELLPKHECLKAEKLVNLV